MLAPLAQTPQPGGGGGGGSVHCYIIKFKIMGAFLLINLDGPSDGAAWEMQTLPNTVVSTLLTEVPINTRPVAWGE